MKRQTDGQTHMWKDRQINEKTDIWTDRQMDRQADGQKDRLTHRKICTVRPIRNADRKRRLSTVDHLIKVACSKNLLIKIVLIQTNWY
jgi:hypothetical protein